MRKTNLLSLTLFVFLFALASLEYAAAQQAPSAGGIPVHILVTVEPKHGSNVPNITRDDVMVHQGKDRDQVTDWTPAQGTGLRLSFSF